MEVSTEVDQRVKRRGWIPGFNSEGLFLGMNSKVYKKYWRLLCLSVRLDKQITIGIYSD